MKLFRRRGSLPKLKMWRKLARAAMQRQSTVRLGPLPSATTKKNRTASMPALIPSIGNTRKKWLAELFANIATSRVGVALLAAQITDLENRCAQMHSRLDKSKKRRGATTVSSQLDTEKRFRWSGLFLGSGLCHTRLR
jgi:hypothetical protein